MLFSLILLLALTRAEIIERMRAPVVTYAEGLVQVYADCPEDMRREFQSPIARFAADTITGAYQGLNRRPVKFRKPGIMIHIGDERTNRVDVYSTVVTNDRRIVTRIYVKSPALADLDELQREVLKGFFRSVLTNEVSDVYARQIYRRGNPRLRIADEREELEEWFAGRGPLSDEDALKRMRKVIEPGFASRRDLLIFASRLYLYPMYHDAPFAGKYSSLSFRDAIALSQTDLMVRLLSIRKAEELIVFGGGRGDRLKSAAEAYAHFLLELAQHKKNDDELKNLLDQADNKLSAAWESAK